MTDRELLPCPFCGAAAAMAEGGMRKLIRTVAKRLGVKTGYHVSAEFKIADGHATISMTVTVTPWIHVDNYKDLVDYVHTKATGAEATPTITSITRLGP